MFPSMWKRLEKLVKSLQKMFRHDSPMSISVLLFREGLEVLFQNAAFFYYAGSQHDFVRWLNGSGNDIILAQSSEYVVIFSWFLSLNCIILGIMWLLYLFKNDKCKLKFFAYSMFIIDLFFDAFYAIFPLLLIGENINFFKAAASLNSESFILFMAIYLPLCYIVFKLWIVLKIADKFSKKFWYLTFRIQAIQSLPSTKTLGNVNVNIDRYSYVSDNCNENSYIPPQIFSINSNTSRLLSDASTITIPNTNMNNAYIKIQSQVSLYASPGTSLQSTGIDLSINTLSVNENILESEPPPVLEDKFINPTKMDKNSQREKLSMTKGSHLTTKEKTPELEEMLSDDQMSDTSTSTDSMKSDDDNDPINQETVVDNERIGSSNIRIKCVRWWSLLCHGPKFLIPFENIASLHQSAKLAASKYENIVIVQGIRRIVLFVYAFAWVVYGMVLLSFTMDHFYHKTAICDQYNRVYNQEYPHLFLWNHCSYKVYPISDDLPCNCRNLDVPQGTIFNWISDAEKLFADSNFDKNDSLTVSERVSNYSSVILTSMFKKFYMLETLHIYGDDVGGINQLTDELMTQRMLKILSLEKCEVFQLSDNFALKYPYLEYLQMDYTSLVSLPPYESMSKLKHLKWFSIANNAIDFGYDSNPLSFVCDFQSLERLSISGNQNIILPHCMIDDNTLSNLKVIDAEYGEIFNISLFNNPNLDAVNLVYSFVSVDDFPINESFEYRQNIEYYLQGSALCQTYHEYDENFTEFQLLHPYIYQFIQQTQCCEYHCESTLSSVHCKPYRWRNGECDEDCNTNQCYYDGGDCNQLCNFLDIDSIDDSAATGKVCNYTMWDNNICDDSCNNTNCNFDFCDCGMSSTTNENCNFDYKQCFKATDCAIVFTNINQSSTIDGINYDNWLESWINDGFCDMNCNNEICNYDGGNDCQNCDSSYGCDIVMEYFSFIANSITDDYKVSSDELCNLWDILPPLIQTFDADWDADVDGWNYLNCSTVLTQYDRNGDDKLNAYETQLLVFNHTLYGAKVKQMNCSFCAPTVDIYYN